MNLKGINIFAKVAVLASALAIDLIVIIICRLGLYIEPLTIFVVVVNMAAGFVIGRGVI